MPSLQLLQLTEHGRGLLASRRKTLAIVSGVLLAGGALAYARSGQVQRRRRSEAANCGGDDGDALARNGERLGQNGVNGTLAGTTKRRKGALNSLHFLAAILLKKIGPNGTRYLLGLMLTAVYIALVFTAFGISQTSAMTSDSTKAQESTASILAFIDRRSKIDSTSDEGIKLEKVDGNLDFNHVSFKYPACPDVQVFSDFTLGIRSGKTVALVGESGSGKSTAIFF